MFYEIMKKFRIIVGLVAAVMFSLTYTSCEELEDIVDDSQEIVSGEEAFFPKAFADKTVAAWYSWTEKDKDKTKTEAVFLFTDNTFVVTKNKVHTDGRYERDIEATGTYTLTEGDYTNGKAAVVIADGGTMTVVIENGKLKKDDEVFTKQDNAKLPKASDPASGGGNNNQGGNNQGDNLEPFFPKAYAGKSIAAWYSYSGTISEETEGYSMKFTASIYFFEDGTYVATNNMVVSGPTGTTPERAIASNGKYTILEGNLTTGKVKIIMSETESVTIEIKDGKFEIEDVEAGGKTVYSKQDNTKVPEPSEPTEEHNQGGGNEDEQGPAFFPTTYADKTVVAWYSYTESEPAETRVEAVFLFDDNTLIVTEHKIFDQSVQMQDERYIWAVGTFSLSGDYNNGTADVILDEGRKINVSIKDGGLVVEYNYDMVYIRQDLKDLPTPLEPREQGGDNQGGDNQGGDNQGNANLTAWYKQTVNIDGSDYEIAVVLLDDGTIAFTSTPVVTEAGTIAMTQIIGVGTYKIIEGDLTNGSVQIVMFDEPKVFTVSYGVASSAEDDGGVRYIKQDNSQYKGPTNFGNGNGGDDGDDDDDGEIEEEFDTDLFKAYLPSDYAKKTVSAWYMAGTQDDNKMKIEAVFLFSDGSLLVTKTKVWAKSDGRSPEYGINATGTYVITSGDYSSGIASVILADGVTMEVGIEDGVLTAMNTDFYYMPNEALAQLTTSGSSN